MDAFFASVEQRDNPSLAGKPVAVGGSGKRGVVAAASYEARAFGVYSAMSSKIALSKCPELIFVPPRFDVYKTVSLVIRAIFREYTDLIEPLSLDEAYLDVTTNKKGIVSATQIAREIKERIKFQTDLTASAGISVNKFLAKIASDVNKPNGIYVIPPKSVQSFIETLPVDKFFGVGKITAVKMKKLGIHTGLDLKMRDESELIKIFGKTGKYFFDIANGIDDRPVVPDRIRKSLGAEHTYEEDLGDRTVLEEKIKGLAKEVYRRLKKSGKPGRTLTVKIKFADFTQITRSNTVDHPIQDYDSIIQLSDKIFTANFKEGMKIRLLGITISNFLEKAAKKEQLTIDFE